MITLDAGQAGAALGLPPLAGPVRGVSIDTRTLRAGDLFVALRGERFDGHDFVGAALEAGASGVVVEREVWERGHVSSRAEGAPLYQVEDTLAALGALAREVRRASAATVFAITGSVGKTSTKDLLRAMVARVGRVAATAGNQNNEVGVPLTLLGIEPGTEAVVVEMGMRGRGQIADLAMVVEPDIAVITNIHPVHLELLGSLEAIAEAKAEIVAGLKVGGAGVVPAGSAVLQPYIENATCRVISFSAGEEGDSADVRGWLETGEQGALLVVRWAEGEARVESPRLPRHQVENAVAAVAACYAAGLPPAECALGLADVRFSEGRGEIVEVGGLCLINDTYNANPAAVRAALDDLIRLAAERHGRPVAVLGDMLELGPAEMRFHEEVGEYAAKAGVRALWGVGRRSGATVEGFSRQMAKAERADADWSAGHVGSCEETSWLEGLREGDVVLFKASRSLHLEAVVETLTERAGETSA